MSDTIRGQLVSAVAEHIKKNGLPTHSDSILKVADEIALQYQRSHLISMKAGARRKQLFVGDVRDVIYRSGNTQGDDTNELETLRAQLAEAQARNAELEAQLWEVAKVRGELSGYKVNAEADFLRIAHKAKRIYNGDVDMQTAQALALGIYSIATQSPAPAAPVPATPAAQTPQVTLTDAEIDTFARFNSDATLLFEHYVPAYPKIHRAANEAYYNNVCERAAMPANHDAIARRRKELGLG